MLIVQAYILIFMELMCFIYKILFLILKGNIFAFKLDSES